MSAVPRVSIPNSVKKTIQNIKEIAGNHSDEEIYSTLKECSMDPNETTQKLLFQDTFHEVRRKRDKRKESNREAVDTNWRPGLQGRVGRTGRGNYGLRYSSYGRNMNAVKENGIVQILRDKDITSLDSNNKAGSPEKHSTAYVSRSVDNLPNGVVKAEHFLDGDPSFSGGLSIEETAIESKKSGIYFQKKLSVPSTTHGSSSSSITIESEPVKAATFDVSILVPASATKREANSGSVILQDVGVSQLSFVKERGVFEKNHSIANGRVLGNSLEIRDAFQSTPSNVIAGTTSNSRPSSNYGNRSQHASASFKAGPTMEWKPKSLNVNHAPSSEVLRASSADLSKDEDREASSYFLGASDSVVSDISKKVSNLEDLRISDTQHVIIPDHLQVPEAERTGLSFGSFGSNFGLDIGLKVEPEKIGCPEEVSELLGEHEEDVEQLPPCAKDDFPVIQESTYSGQQPEIPENHSDGAADILSSITPTVDYDHSKAELSLVAQESQRSIMHAAPVYSNFGLVPQTIGSPFPTFEGAEMHAREASRLPGFIVPQPFDPSTNYYASIYRPTDGDGRFSPFLTAGAPKYAGNIAVLPTQPGQSPQESGNSMVLSSTGPTPAILQTSVASNQQPVPVFRQPAGLHISHFPPNYSPYNQYFSPFYVPPPATIHHFLGNAAIFPQQTPTGNIYPPPTVTAGPTHVKYPIPQYKTTVNAGLPGQVTYGINPAGYSSTGGNSSCSEDLSSSQFKENYVYITGQQSEGSAVWISPPGRDISTLQAGSYYNIPPHGQPVAFAPTQAGHAAAFAGVYHPTQSVATGSVHPLLQQSQAVNGASEIIGPASVYQQPQRSSQINWVNNF